MLFVCAAPISLFCGIYDMATEKPHIYEDGAVIHESESESESVPTKCISWIFDIGDLRSGHFRDLPIISQWAKIKLPVLCFIFSLYEWNHIR